MPSASRSNETTEILKVVGEELRFAFNIILCAFYICWWRTKHYIWYDPKLKKRSVYVAAISALILFLDLVLFFIGKEIPVWIGPTAFIFLIPTALILALHRVGEVRKVERERSFADRIGPLADALTDLSGATLENKDNVLTEFVSKLLKQVHEEFGEVKRASITASVMSKDQDGRLRIAYLFPPGTSYDPNVSFEPGQGGAGYSFQESTIVYIPSIRYTHGITISIVSEKGVPNFRYGLKRRLYVPISKEFEIFESFLCLPVTSKMGTHAVMNVDSRDRDGFDLRDIYTLRAYARILGDGISLTVKDLMGETLD
jgi:hypothetical protein